MIAVPKPMRALFQYWRLSAVSAFSLAVAMAVGILGLSVLNTILIMAPPVPEADRLLTVYSRTPSKTDEQISYLDYIHYRDNNRSFSSLAAAPNSIGVRLDNNFEGREVKVVTRPVSTNYFTVMGIQPYLGTFFTTDSDDAQTPAAIMTYSCWKRLGSDLNIVGKMLTGRTIIGVLPRSFVGAFYGINGDLFTTLKDVDNNQTWRERRDIRTLYLTGRLQKGVTPQQAEAELVALSGQLAAAYPTTNKDRVAAVTRATLLPPDAASTARLMGAILMLLVLLIVLIACANVANLLLAVAVGRRQQAAIKLALGASRGRLIREFLVESLILCTAGAALGYAAAAFLIARFSDLTVALPMVGVMTFSLNLKLDGMVIGLTVLLLAIASLASGLPPALYASSPALSQVLSGELVVGGTRKGLRRNALVAIQIAVCTLVLIGMGLCQSSLFKLQHVDLGFSERNLTAVTVYLEAEGYTAERAKAFRDTLRRTVAEIPGVEAVTLASDVPLLGATEIPVLLPDTDAKTTSVAHTIVDPEFFRTLGVPILKGRAFHSGDNGRSPLVMIVNQRLASQLWPGQNPLGRMIEAGELPRRKLTVIGVVADGRHLDLNEDPKPFFYLPLAQNDRPGLSIVARTKGDPRLWVGQFSQVLRGLGLKILVNPVTFENWLNLSLFAERFTAAAVAALSGFGLLLALVGLFASISYSVRERKKELGLRVALGATQGQLLQMILRQTLMVAGGGVLTGVVLGVAATSILRSQLYGIASVEWVVLAPVCFFMLGMSLAVAYVSARPWINVDAMEAVRHT